MDPCESRGETRLSLCPGENFDHDMDEYSWPCDESAAYRKTEEAVNREDVQIKIQRELIGWSKEDLARCKLTAEKPSTQAVGGQMGFSQYTNKVFKTG